MGSPDVPARLRTLDEIADWFDKEAKRIGVPGRVNWTTLLVSSLAADIRAMTSTRHGHVARCSCCDRTGKGNLDVFREPDGYEHCNTTTCHIIPELHPYRDPHCSPAVEPEITEFYECGHQCAPGGIEQHDCKD